MEASSGEIVALIIFGFIIGVLFMFWWTWDF